MKIIKTLAEGGLCRECGSKIKRKREECEVDEVDVVIPAFGSNVYDQVRVFTIHPDHNSLRIVVPGGYEVVMNAEGLNKLVDGSEIMIDVRMPRTLAKKAGTPSSGGSGDCLTKNVSMV